MSRFSSDPGLPAPFVIDEPNQPPAWEVVPLAEALTWIAFQNSMDCRGLEAALTGADLEIVTEARLRLVASVQQLTNLAREGRIGLTGKFVPSPAGNDALVLRAVIPPRNFAEFRQFDILHDGLRRGNGITGRHAPDGFEWMIEAGAQEAYHRVEVNRASLLLAFPARIIGPMVFEEVVAWCSAWIESGKGNGEGPAWQVFRDHPRRGGNNRDHVFRDAWRQAKGLATKSLAETASREIPRDVTRRGGFSA